MKISGGGRCNVTNNCKHISQLAAHYPRGERFLKKTFSQFAVDDTIKWFEGRGVQLKTEPDNRMFPITDNSQTIIDCLVQEARSLGVQIMTIVPISSISKDSGHFQLGVTDRSPLVYEKVIVCTGGSPKPSGFMWLEQLGHTVVPPAPSLFTFNMPGEPIQKLMGLAVKDAQVRIQGTKLQYSGPVLITHWGMSGPAVLKLSAWGARYLNECDYVFKVQVNWTGERKEQEVREMLSSFSQMNRKAKVLNRRLFDLQSRLWEFLILKAGMRRDMSWGELGGKSINRLTNILINDIYSVKGKTTFKEEFVTCGGVDLKEIDPKTMQSKVVPGLYFAGEVLDIDGITGGFNFQGAWTTGFVAGKVG